MCLRVFDAHQWKVSLLGENAVDCCSLGREMLTSICDEIISPMLSILALAPNSKRDKIDKVELMPTLETGRSMAAVGALIAAGYVCGQTFGG